MRLEHTHRPGLRVGVQVWDAHVVGRLDAGDGLHSTRRAAWWRGRARGGPPGRSRAALGGFCALLGLFALLRLLPRQLPSATGRPAEPLHANGLSTQRWPRRTRLISSKLMSPRVRSVWMICHGELGGSRVVAMMCAMMCDTANSFNGEQALPC